tara:strand:+ start:148 stop:522 length:375 start_codon:yes stop_codon:yes gene_type:complete
MAGKKYKILVPKAGASDSQGTQVKLYQHDEIVDAKEEWQDSLMGAFVQNGWAMEVKADGAEESLEVEADIKRARNEDGTLKGDDPSTPDVNEAWEGGKAPKKKATKKKSTAKKTTAKKTTKKKS